MTDTEDRAILELARDWKAGDLTPVHPEIGRRLNAALVRAREDPVPFIRATSLTAPTLVELVRARHGDVGRR